nr:immunoglobulin heavy chain junction region [Macaca mulatta]MOW45725.1 immunoglobulin heavy chain junction region [Macaca mulatta]MOW45791.1 immunoglobulin heavy chain junction region [Macaca mulatta]MOW45819.1 immunoglobulin heavy chain junction region [Macaca mulatta]MOW45820.1 immunoglobulin heavy chain junction region [Macaca mulatta]
CARGSRGGYEDDYGYYYTSFDNW